MSESQEIESRPKILDPGYSNGLARYPKMCCFICTHAISLLQSINIPLLSCKRYMQKVEINRNAVSVLNS